MLKYHADMRSDLRQVEIAHDDAGAVDAALFPIQVDSPGVGPFEPVDTAQQGRFARARWSEHTDRFTLVDLETNVREHFDIPEPLGYPGHIENLAGLRHRPPYRRASATRPIELTPASITRKSPQYRNTAVMKAANGTQCRDWI